MSTEKRKSERTEVFLIFELRPHNKPQDFSLAISTNLSPDGAVIESQGYDLKENDILDLKIKHPKSDLSVNVLGRIVWKKDAWYKCMAGIKFIQIREEEKSILERLVSTGQDAIPQTYSPPAGPERAAMPSPEDSADRVIASTGQTDMFHSSEVKDEAAQDVTEDAPSLEVASDESEPLPHALERSGSSPDPIEPMTEEYGREEKKTETPKPAPVSFVSTTAKEGDAKGRSLKPLISVLTIIAAVVVIIKFEDISREFKAIISNISPVTGESPPGASMQPQESVSESVHDEIAQLRPNSTAVDNPSEETVAREMTPDASHSPPAAIESPPEKPPLFNTEVKGTKDLLLPGETTPDEQRPSIPHMVAETPPSQKSEKKIESPQNEKSNSGKITSVHIKTEPVPIPQPVDIPPDEKITPEPDTPAVKASSLPPMKKAGTSSAPAGTAIPLTKPLNISSRPDPPHTDKQGDHKARKMTAKEVLPDIRRQNFASYEEHFNNNENGWDIFNTQSSSALITNGEYRMESKLTKGSLINLHHHALPRERDFQIEVYVKSEMEGKNQAYGFVFGASGILNNYVFKINSDNTYSIGRYSMGIWKELVRGSIKDGIIRRDSTNVLKIIRMKRKVYFYINDTNLDTYSIPSFEGNQVGFIVQGKTAMAVDKTHSLIESQNQ